MTASVRLDRLAVLRSPGVTFAVLGLIAGGLAGAASARSAKLGLAVVIALVLTLLALRRPVTLAVIALVGVFLAQRVGSASTAAGSSGGVSYSDALLAAAAFLALPAMIGTPELRRLRVAGCGLGIYLACLLPTVFINFSTRAGLEWTHRLVLVGGGLLVGAWIAREQIIRIALRMLTLVACLVALAAVANTLSHSLAPASPLGLNKNFIGALFGTVLVLVAVAAKQVEIGPRTQAVAGVLIAGGLLASQSRGGELAAVCGLLVAYMLDPRGHSRRARALSALAVVVLAGFAFVSVRAQLNLSKADLNNSSIGVRFNVEKVTRDIWRTSPVDGVGLKYFNAGTYGPFAAAPNNAVDNELAESGVVGLAGFVALEALILGAGVRRRRDGKLVGVAVGVVAGGLLHGMVDIYWIAGSVALPFMIMGMALAWKPGVTFEPESAEQPQRVAAAAHDQARG